MSVNKPALDPRSVAVHSSSAYPEPYRSRVMPRDKRPLGDALGLTRIGVNLTTLSPGKESSMCHWHTHEDEFVYVLEGELVLRCGPREQLLTAGMCAGFAAGAEQGHQRRGGHGALLRPGGGHAVEPAARARPHDPP